MTETWIILGATSSMARALARQLAEQGHALYRAGRDMDDLKRQAADCAARGASQAQPVKFDAREPETFAPILDRLADQEGMLNAAVFVGSMPEQAEIDADPSLVDGTITGGCPNTSASRSRLSAVACSRRSSHSPARTYSRPTSSSSASCWTSSPASC